MYQEFTLPLQVAYLTVVLVILVTWFLVIFRRNRVASAKIIPSPKISKANKIFVYISGAVIILMIGIDYHNLYTSIFLPAQRIQSGQFVTPVVQAANNLLLYLGTIFAATIPLLIINLITASQLKSGIFSELSSKELMVRQTPKYLRLARISVCSSIQGINWVLILLGLQYFILSSFWQGFIITCVIVNILMQIVKRKLRRS